ncbi:MAG: hypothetical protein KDD61_13430, partial [Bdellovibrionales bacterium]|nr:hypothetical protein [Bdellovibrionales bacterium]
MDTYDKGKFNFSFVSIFFLFQLASLIVVSGTIVGSAFRNIDQLNKTAFVVGAQALGAITAIALQYLQNKRKQKNRTDIQILILALICSLTNFFSAETSPLWYAAIFIRNACATYFGSVALSSIREISKNDFLKLNQSTQIANMVSNILAFAVGPILAAIYSLQYIFLVDIVLLSISLLTLYISKIPDLASHRSAINFPLLKELTFQEGLKVPFLNLLIWSVAGLLHVLEVPILVQRFKVEGSLISWFYALPLVINLIVLKLINIRKIQNHFPTVALISSLVIIALTAAYLGSTSIYVVLIILISFGAANGVYVLAQTSILQKINSKELRTLGYLLFKLSGQLGLALASTLIVVLKANPNNVFSTLLAIFFTLILVTLFFIMPRFKKSVLLQIILISFFGFTSHRALGNTKFYFPLHEVPKTLDPVTARSVTNTLINGQIFQTLYKFNPNNQLEPQLVEKHFISNDGKEIRIHLKQNISFSDGTPLTSGDVISSWTRSLMKHKSALSWAVGDVSGFEQFLKSKKGLGISTQNENVIVIKLNRAFPRFLQAISTPYFSITKKSGSSFIGTGAYQKLSHTKDSIRLKRVGNHNISSLAPLEIVFERMKKNENKARFDIVDPHQREFLNTSSGTNKIHFQFLHSVVAFLNTKAFPFKNSENRCSFLSNLNKNMKKSGYKLSEMEKGAPFAWDFFKDENDFRHKTKDISTPINVLYANSFVAFSKNNNSHVSASFKKNGITLSFEEVPINTLLKRLDEGKYQAAILGYGPDYLDIEAMISPLLKTGQQFNFVKYSNPYLDDLIDIAHVTSDESTRITIFKKIKNILDKDCPLRFLGTQERPYLVSRRWQI